MVDQETAIINDQKITFHMHFWDIWLQTTFIILTNAVSNYHILYGGMGKEPFFEINKTAVNYTSAKRLRHSVPIDTIGVDISQCVRNNKGYEFLGVEKLLWGTFLPHLFFGNSKYLPTTVGTLSTMPFKKSSLGLQNLVTSADERLLGLQCAST